MRIIEFSGACVKKCGIWPNVQSAFAIQYPRAEFVVVEAENCTPFEVQRWHTLIQRCVERFDDGRGTIVVGHSLGGMLADAVGALFRSTPLLGIITIFTPRCYWGVPLAAWYGLPESTKAPAISFEASDDEIVFGETRHRRSISHTVLESDHMNRLIRNPNLSRQIAETARKHFSP